MALYLCPCPAPCLALSPAPCLAPGSPPFRPRLCCRGPQGAIAAPRSRETEGPWRPLGAGYCATTTTKEDEFGWLSMVPLRESDRRFQQCIAASRLPPPPTAPGQHKSLAADSVKPGANPQQTHSKLEGAWGLAAISEPAGLCLSGTPRSGESWQVSSMADIAHMYTPPSLALISGDIFCNSIV